jgi:hypothetical protein
MNKTSNLEQLTNFAFYVIVFFHTAYFFVHVAVFLLLPRREGVLPLLLSVSFAVGILVDMFLQQFRYTCIGLCTNGVQ